MAEFYLSAFADEASIELDGQIAALKRNGITHIELRNVSGALTDKSDDELCEIVAKTSVRFIVNSDAHSKERIGDTALIAEQLKRVDFPMDRIDNIDGRLPTFRFTEFKKKM